MTTTTERGAAPVGAAPAADLTQLAAGNRHVAKELVGAERDRLAAAQQVAVADADAERRLRVAEAKLRLQEQRERLDDNRADRRRQVKDAKRKTRRARAAQRRHAVSSQVNRAIDYARSNAAAVYSAVVYGMAVGGAVYGQVDAASSHGLPTPVGIAAAVAIEGFGLAMALTAQQQRLRNERALAARVLTWAATAAAVGINYFGHYGNPAKAVGLSVLSAIGIVVWEIRSAAKHRKALRAAGVLAEPAERFGLRRWIAAPGETWDAWCIDARERVSPGAAQLIARAATVRAERAEREATARAEAVQRAATAEVMRLASKAAHRAARKGQAGPALAALVCLARTGHPAPVPAITAKPEPVDEATRELCEMVRAQARGARMRLVGSSAAVAPQYPFTPAHRLITAPAAPTQRTTDESTAPTQPRGGEPTQRTTAEPTQRPAGESSGEPTGSARREPAQRRTTPTRTTRRPARLTATADSDSADTDAALAAAYPALVKELGREPSGTELARRAGTSKATANRWKSTRGADQRPPGQRMPPAVSPHDHIQPERPNP